MKDILLCAPMIFSALIMFGLSFSLFLRDGRPYVFAGSLIVYVACLLLADRKRDLFLASLIILLLQIVFGAVMTGLQATHNIGHH